MGRQSKLNLELQKTMTGLLAKGATDKDACELAGVHVATFYRWLEQGEDEGDSEELEPYREFREAVTRARAKANQRAVDAFRSGLLSSKIVDEVEEEVTETRLRRDGTPYEYKHTSKRKTTRRLPPDWRAGEAWLKRRDKANWSERVEQTGADGNDIGIQLKAFDYRKILAPLAPKDDG